MKVRLVTFHHGCDSLSSRRFRRLMRPAVVNFF
jgi:hypothetical protein